MYNPKEDNTQASVNKNKPWFTHYNTTEQVFKSTLLTTINHAHFRYYENKILREQEGYPSDCVCCGVDMMFVPSTRSIKTSINRMACESCMESHIKNMRTDDYFINMVAILSERNIKFVEIIESKLTKLKYTKT